MAASIQAISGLLQYAADICRDPFDLTPETWQGSFTLEEIFTTDRVTTRKQWHEEERIWAKALNEGYRVTMCGA